MKYATLGRMGAEASRVAFGMRQLNDPADIERHAENVVYAYRRGINFFETSVSYAEGKAETILGRAIREMKRGELPFYVMSKCHAAESGAFRRNLESSLERLGLDTLDIFTCLWGVKSLNEWLGAVRFGAVKELERARDEGLIRYIAITSHMKDDDMKRVMSDYPFDLNIIGFNVINARFRMEGLRASFESGAGNIAMCPLGSGRLVMFKDVFGAIRIRKDQSLVQAAYDYVLSSPFVHSVIGGFNEKSEIDEAVSAVETHVPYTAEEMALVQERLAARISPLEHERRFEVAKAINERPYILREEAAELFGVYPMSL